MINAENSAFDLQTVTEGFMTVGKKGPHPPLVVTI